MSIREVARFCKTYREHLGWSLAALAKAAGLTLETIQNLENNGNCSQETLLKIAHAIGADIRELMKLKTRMVRGVENLLRIWYP